MSMMGYFVKTAKTLEFMKACKSKNMKKYRGGQKRQTLVCNVIENYDLIVIDIPFVNAKTTLSEIHTIHIYQYFAMEIAPELLKIFK